MPNRPECRELVYNALDGERDYQDALKPDRTDGSVKTVGDFLTLMQAYMALATLAYAKHPGNEPALHEIRKITALGVQAMEKHGAPERVNVTEIARREDH